MTKRGSVLSASFFAAVLLIISVAGLSAEPDISIYYTSSLNGNLIGCECKGVPKAGLSTTAAYLRNLDPETSIILDLGDFSDARVDELLSDKLLGLFKGIGYTVSALGDQELGSGVDYFKSASRKLDFISNNIKIDGDYLSDGPLLIEKNGIKVGIAAVIESSVFFFYPDEVKSRIEVFNPAIAAADALAELKSKRSSYNILLFHGHSEEARAVFNQQEGWDAVLFAHDQMLIDETDGKRIFASPGEEGNRVGRIDLSFRFKKLKEAENTIRYFKYEVDPEDPAVLQAFEDYKKELIANLKNGKK
jgi:2',3'-cyclic-nucleotide 2'-phosphodiesterase (5'-nucleotidase family)